MSDKQIIAVLMEIMSGFKSDEEFETFVANAKTLWAARDVAKALAAGCPASAARN